MWAPTHPNERAAAFRAGDSKVQQVDYVPEPPTPLL